MRFLLAVLISLAVSSRSARADVRFYTNPSAAAGARVDGMKSGDAMYALHIGLGMEVGSAESLVNVRAGAAVDWLSLYDDDAGVSGELQVDFLPTHRTCWRFGTRASIGGMPNLSRSIYSVGLRARNSVISVGVDLYGLGDTWNTSRPGGHLVAASVGLEGGAGRWGGVGGGLLVLGLVALLFAAAPAT